MADPTFTPIRSALADAYLGDTKLARAMFSSDPSLFDQRLLSLLSGLGQGVPSPLPSAISGDDLKAAMAAIDPTDNSERVRLLGLLKTIASSFPVADWDLIPSPLFFTSKVEYFVDSGLVAQDLPFVSGSYSYSFSPIPGASSFHGKLNLRLDYSSTAPIAPPSFSSSLSLSRIISSFRYEKMGFPPEIVSAIRNGFGRSIGPTVVPIASSVSNSVNPSDRLSPYYLECSSGVSGNYNSTSELFIQISSPLGFRLPPVSFAVPSSLFLSFDLLHIP